MGKSRVPELVDEHVGSGATRTGKKDVYVIVFDGGSLGNPGQGYGSYRLSNPAGKHIHESIEFPPELCPMTNNQAEYRTLIAAMEKLVELLGERAKDTNVQVEGDSQLVLNQLQGKWKVKNAGLKPLHRAGTEMTKQFAGVTFRWHPRERSVRILGH